MRRNGAGRRRAPAPALRPRTEGPRAQVLGLPLLGTAACGSGAAGRHLAPGPPGAAAVSGGPHR
eukprot:7855231-Pyramimonas_sp.AAC.1